jgi:predicted DCC family thiol-disulfide oxidoreductase YuxK
MIYLLRRLGRSYRFMAAAMEVLPPGLLDRCYDAIARRRRKLFAKPLDVCPAIPPHWRSRFYL